MPGPLQGIRVVDLSWIIAGPLVSRLMADFGAEVVKVESTRRMDIARANRTPLYGVLPGDANSNPDTGGYFQDANAHKKSCTLNLETTEGRELLKRLISVSDVAICNLAGDMYERWGIGYEAAKELNPGIILVNIPSMESAGPRKNWRGFGDMFVGMGGLKSTSGHPDDPPLPWGHQYADFASNPLHALAAIMAALLERDRSGEGQFIEVSQYESTVALMGPALLDYSLTGEVRPRPGNHSAHACPHNFYRCAGEDSWCAIAVQSDEQWRRLVEFAGVEELATLEYATLEGRKRSENEIDAALETWTSRWDRQELAEALQEHEIPGGPYQKIDEMLHRDPTLSERHWARLPHPVGRDFLVFRNPIEARRNPPKVALGPLIGQHTFEVLTEVIGLTEDEVAEYAAAGAIG